MQNGATATQQELDFTRSLMKLGMACQWPIGQLSETTETKTLSELAETLSLRS